MQHTKFLYDGWNMIAELNALSANAVTRTYVWGTDLSGSFQGAGGVGGLLFASLQLGASTSTHAPAFDGNGNAIAYVDMATGVKSATYEYGAFGEILVAEGPMQEMLPFRFSTKFTDNETGLLYYGLRYYNPGIGRWLSRDPIEEQGGVNLFGFVGNDAINDLDPLGLKNFKVGSPTEPPMTFDDDFVFDPKAKATAQDFKNWSKWASRLIGAELIRWDLYDATRAYRHYLRALGADLEINYEKAYREDGNVMAGVNDEIFAAQVDAERLAATAGPKFQITGDASRLKDPATENWQKTIGHHWIWGSADVEACGDQFTMVITIHEKDRYNFNRGKRDIATGLPDNANGRFTALGWAKPFMTYGKLTKKVTWKKGASFTNVNIQDAGR